MKLVSLDEKWHDLIPQTALAELDQTPFLSRCRKRNVSVWELRAFVAQQFHYSRHFTRYLCALMGNLQRESDRADLATNLFEELGLGEHGGVAHSTIYRNMLNVMEVDPATIPVAPATQALVDAMLTACSDPNPMVGLGALCLGAEAIVPHVYSQIMRGFLSIGEPAEHLEFFRIHIEDDDEHAVTMRRIIDRDLVGNPGQKAVLQASAERLISARAAFFRGLRLATDLPLSVSTAAPSQEARH